MGILAHRFAQDDKGSYKLSILIIYCIVWLFLIIIEWLMKINTVNILKTLNQPENDAVNAILQSLTGPGYEYVPSNQKERFPRLNDAIASIENNSLLRGILIDILSDPNFCSFHDIHSFDVDQNYLDLKRCMVISITPDMAAEYILLIHMVISIRIFHERMRLNLGVPSLKVSLEEACNDFECLKNNTDITFNEFGLSDAITWESDSKIGSYVAFVNTFLPSELQYQAYLLPQTISNEYPKNVKYSKSLGKDAVNYFIEEERTRCSQFNQTSLAQLIRDPKIVGKIILRLNQNYADSPLGIMGQKFVRQLYYDFVPTQSQPMLIKFLAHLASKATSRKEISLLNLCGGWGDRLVGALAAPEINRIIETDPNTALIPFKHQMISTFGDAGKDIRLYGLPAEDLTEAQLKPDGRENELVVVCPPYYTTERYAGEPEQQSHSRYTDITKWLDEFLFELVKRSFYSLSEYGILAMHIGLTEEIRSPNEEIKIIYGSSAMIDKKYNLPFILDCYMGEFKEIFRPLNQHEYAPKTARSAGSYVRIYQKLYFPRMEYPISSENPHEYAPKMLRSNGSCVIFQKETDRMRTSQRVAVSNHDEAASRYKVSLYMYTRLMTIKTKTPTLTFSEKAIADETYLSHQCRRFL
jgi:hypothetical protein